AADLGIAETGYAGRVGQLRESRGDRVVDKDLEIAVAVLASQVPVRRKGDISSIIGNRGLKVAIRDTVSDVPGRSLRYLSQPRAVEQKNFGVTIGVCSQRIVLGSKSYSRSVLRNCRRSSARAAHLGKGRRVIRDVRANRAK